MKTAAGSTPADATEQCLKPKWLGVPASSPPWVLAHQSCLLLLFPSLCALSDSSVFRQPSQIKDSPPLLTTWESLLESQFQKCSPPPVEPCQSCKALSHSLDSQSVGTSYKRTQINSHKQQARSSRQNFSPLLLTSLKTEEGVENPFRWSSSHRAKNLLFKTIL